MVLKITAENFEEEVLKSDRPVLLDLWAVWCGPCQMIGPDVEDIAEEHPEIKVGKINVDEEMELAARFKATAIPMLIYMVNGEVKEKSVGVIAKSAIEEMISR